MCRCYRPLSRRAVRRLCISQRRRRYQTEVKVRHSLKVVQDVLVVISAFHYLFRLLVCFAVPPSLSRPSHLLLWRIYTVYLLSRAAYAIWRVAGAFQLACSCLLMSFDIGDGSLASGTYDTHRRPHEASPPLVLVLVFVLVPCSGFTIVLRSGVCRK